METWLDMDLLLTGTFFLAFGLEIWRFSILYTLNLNLTWPGGWRFAHYLPFLAALAGIGPAGATQLTYWLTVLWRLCTALPYPVSLYTGGLFLVTLTGAIAFLAFRAFFTIVPPPQGKDGQAEERRIREILLPVVLLTLAGLTCFIVEPLRWVFGGTLVVLVTSAFGKLIPFTGWNDLVSWLRQEPSSLGIPPSPTGQVRVLFWVEAEGVLRRRGEHIEIGGPQLVGPVAPGNRSTELSQKILDATRLGEIAETLPKLRRREDLLERLVDVIARNTGKILSFREAALEKSPDEREKKVQNDIRTLLRQELGKEGIQSMLYWYYEVPEEGGQFAIVRVPNFDLKPLLTFREYMGLFLCWEARRRRLSS